MANVRLFGETSGFVQLAAPDAAGNNTITLPTTGTELVAADAAGNITIDGTATFAVGASGTPAITASGDANTGIYFPAADTIAFTEGGNEVVRIDSSGRVLVGTTSATGNQTDGELVLQGTASSQGEVYLSRNSTPANTGSALGFINFTGSNGSDSAGIKVYSDGGTWTDGSSHPSRITFVTCADGATTTTERMRIASNGDVGIGTTSPQTMLQIGDNTSGNGVPKLRLHRGSGSDYFELNCSGGSAFLNVQGGGQLKLGASGSETLRIYSTSIYSFSNVAPFNDNTYTSGENGARWSAVWAANGTIQTSDQREKTEITNSSLGSDFIKSLRPVSYKWVEGGKRDTGEVDEENHTIYESVPGERTHWGFLAQEVKQAVDAAGVDFGGWVLTDKDDPDSQQALRYDQFIAPLTKALQEALAKIETLETANTSQAATIAALDARLTALEP